jgi:hypothetical protein
MIVDGNVRPHILWDKAWENTFLVYQTNKEMQRNDYQIMEMDNTE